MYDTEKRKMIFDRYKIMKYAVSIILFLMFMSCVSNAGESKGSVVSHTGTFQDSSNYTNHPPRCEKDVYSVNVSEAAPIGTSILRLSATCVDPDNGEAGRLTFSLRQNSYTNFRIDVSSGSFYTTALLDHEVRTNYLFVVAITDHGTVPKETLVSVNITILDENDNGLRFSRNIYRAHILETAPTGSVVVKMTATDADTERAHNIRYKILSSVPAKYIFSIDPVSGLVTTSAPLYYEMTTSYNITVQAYENKTMSAIAHLLVFVDAVNLHAPVFQGTTNNTYIATVLEIAAPGTAVMKVHATDPDSNLNGAIRYYLQPPESFHFPFTVRSDGTILTNAALDREARDTYHFRIRAADQGIPQLYSVATVKVKVLDANDNAPMFSQSSYTVNLAAPTPAGRSVIRIQAVDLDSGQNAQVRFNIKNVSPANDSGIFLIDEYTGEIKTAKPLDPDHQMNYTLTVSASDGGIIRLVSLTKVFISTIPRSVTDAFGNPFG